MPFHLSKEEQDGLWLGRIWRPGIGPSVVTLREGMFVDITSAVAPTVRDIFERDDPSGYVANAPGQDIVALEDIAPDVASEDVRLLAPCDLQAIKASGVTFAKSMVERVIEEQAAGDPNKAKAIRERISARIGESLWNIVPGSDQAEKAKEALIAEGLWSQYLEVGIGPDAEVFSKSQTLSAVGWGANVGLHPQSVWNNSEPEIVLAVNSRGQIVAATIGNDINLRDFEGRSALLLSKAKDNNASCAIGPMFRLFDNTYSMDSVANAELEMTVEGPEGYILNGRSLMSEISRDPADIVAQTIGRHHQYPDGFVLFLGTLFAPTEDRDEPGQGFTHKVGDKVSIACNGLGTLTNTVKLSTESAEWTFGVAAFMRNLASRDLI